MQKEIDVNYTFVYQLFFCFSKENPKIHSQKMAATVRKNDNSIILPCTILSFMLCHGHALLHNTASMQSSSLCGHRRFTPEEYFTLARQLFIFYPLLVGRKRSMTSTSPRDIEELIVFLAQTPRIPYCLRSNLYH